LKELGYDTNNKLIDLDGSSGIGNLAARTVIEAIKGDGSNENGKESRSNGIPYFNYIN